MSQTKCASKGKRSNKTLTALSVAGVSLAATAASSAAVLVPATAPAMPLGEEEISGVTLATFHLLDQEKAAVKDDLLQLAGCGRGCGGRGCGGRGCRGCGRGCGGHGCRGGWGGCGGCGGCGCGGGWCLSWGGCRPWC